MSVLNTEIVRRYFDVTYNQRNLEIGDELLASDLILHGSQDIVGIQAWKKYAAAYLKAIPEELMITIDDIFAEGHKAVARFTVQATHQGPLMGVPPTGKEVQWMGIGIFYLEGGKITDIWGVNDIYSLMQQIDAIK